MTMRNNLATEGDLGRFEPRDSTKSHHTTARSMEVCCGEVQKWRLRDSRRKEKNGREGLAFYKVISRTCAEEGRGLYLVSAVATVCHLGCC